MRPGRRTFTSSAGGYFAGIVRKLEKGEPCLARTIWRLRNEEWGKNDGRRVLNCEAFGRRQKPRQALFSAVILVIVGFQRICSGIELIRKIQETPRCLCLMTEAACKLTDMSGTLSQLGNRRR